MSGIKAHTIRIWEKRYSIVEPQRTASNIRLYSDDDLKKILNVSLLNNHGIKISNIVGMSKDELNKKVIELSEGKPDTHIHIDRLITGMLDLDEAAFERDLSELERKFGFEYTITDIVYAFLEKIGLLWQTGSITPAHEHFISNLIRQRVIVAIAGIPVPKDSTLRAVLFLPESEMHEIGLLFYHYLARKSGIKTYYLGQAVPYNDLKNVCEIHRPHLLITSFTSFPSPQDLNTYLTRLADDFPTSRILASGAVLRRSSFHYPRNLTVFQTANELKDLLRKL